MKDDVVSLSGVVDFDITEDFDISSFDASELDIISSFYKQKFDTTEKLKKRFKRVSGVMMDTSVNSHGFSLSEKGLKSIVNHFEATKGSKVLHRKFIDHKFQDIEKQIGKLTKIYYDDKTQELMYNGVDDKKHPVTDRIDSFNSVSSTIAHGDRSCSNCGKAFKSKYTQDCDCKEMHPVSNRAMNIELSYVSFPAYDGTSVNVDAFSSDIQNEIKIFLGDEMTPDEFKHLLEPDITTKDTITFHSEGTDNKLKFDIAKGNVFWEFDNKTEPYYIWQKTDSLGDPDPIIETEEIIEEEVKTKVSPETIKELVELAQEVKELRDALKD